MLQIALVELLMPVLTRRLVLQTDHGCTGSIIDGVQNTPINLLPRNWIEHMDERQQTQI